MHDERARQNHLLNRAGIDRGERALDRGLVLHGQRIGNERLDRPVRQRSDCTARRSPYDPLGEPDDGIAAAVERQRAHGDTETRRTIESGLDECRGTTHMVRACGDVDCLRGTGCGEPVRPEVQDNAVIRAVAAKEIVFRPGGDLQRRLDRAHRLVPMSNCAAPMPSCTRRQRLNPASVIRVSSSAGGGRYAVDAGRYRYAVRSDRRPPTSGTILRK
jgi:hypothetical protein